MVLDKPVFSQMFKDLIVHHYVTDSSEDFISVPPPKRGELVRIERPAKEVLADNPHFSFWPDRTA